MSYQGLDSADRAVAVVAVGAILPDAIGASQFWQNVLSARYSITDVPSDRWSAADYYDPERNAIGKSYSKIGGWVRDFTFNSLQYRIPPRVAEAMDDSQKWGIEATNQALKDYGYPERPLDKDRVGTIVGNAMGGERHELTTFGVMAPPHLRRAIEQSKTWANLQPDLRAAIKKETMDSLNSGLLGINEDSMPGELANVVAGRIAHVFDFHGANFICDAACASSLAALDAAVEGLISHQFDVALSGGIDRNMGPGTFVKFCKIGALSPDGSRPFAKGANGFVMGEGAAVYLLKRLADAERDGDKIYAVIRAIGASSDGRGKGITAPNPQGQRTAILRAYERAGFDLSTIQLIEAHGTSTSVGDAAEFEVMSKLFAERSHLPESTVAVGSVKSQIGHLKAGAGAAAMLKTVLALHHKTLPPTAQYHEPNPNLRFEGSPLYINTEAKPWDKPKDHPRRAGVSAFGFGGTNFHIVLEEHVPGLLTSRKPQVQVPSSFSASGPGVATAAAASNDPPMLRGLLMVGGDNLNQLKEQLVKVAQDARNGKVPPKQLPTAAQMQSAERIAIDYGSAEELETRAAFAIKKIEDNRPAGWRLARGKGIFRGVEAPGKLAFLFPGQGSQYVNMLRELRDVSPTVRRVFDEADQVMHDRLDGRVLTKLIFVNDEDPKRLEQATEALRHTTVTQPAMLAADAALAGLLKDYGIEPDMVMGHSLGEYAALVAAGVMPFEDALVAVSARAREMANVSIADPGQMAGVIGPYEAIPPVIEKVDGYVVAANLNSHKQTVIAGATKAMDEAMELLRDAGLRVIPLPVSHAFHSKIVAPASGPLQKVISGLRIAPPRLPVVANVDGLFYPQGPDAVPEIIDRLGRQISSPVQFVKGLDTLYEAGARVFVEVGPKKVLASFADECLGGNGDVVALATNNPKKGPEASFGAALAYLYSIKRGKPRAVPQVSTVPVVTTPPAVAPAAPQPVPAASQSTQVPVKRPMRRALDDATTLQLGRLFADFLDQGMRVYGGAEQAPQETIGTSGPVVEGSIVISGAGVGLPGRSKSLFEDDSFDRILRGDQMIEPIEQDLLDRMVDKNVVRLIKSENASPKLDLISNDSQVLHLAGQRGSFDLHDEFGVPKERADAYDITTSMAIAAGIEALRDAGIPLVKGYRKTSTGSFLPDRWMLPKPLADETGVIFASAFPGYNRFSAFNKDYYAYKAALGRIGSLEKLRQTMNGAGQDTTAVEQMLADERAKLEESPYRFSRKFLFEVLAMGHSQFAEYIGARGPNAQVNAACSSTTLATSVAEDWIRSGRCSRVIVIAADDVTSDDMLEWIGAGFLATGAATTQTDVTKAALPFDRRRHGMILGMGAAALVVETQEAVQARGMQGIAELMATELANSGYHGTRLDVDHICMVMDRMMGAAEKRHGFDRKQIAKNTVFISHETYTPARGGSAAAEVNALRTAFGDAADDIIIANTKGFTGHPMGVGIEDALAVKILERQIVPPIPNFKEEDPELGAINLSKGGHYPVEYALRFSAGFGSQIAISLMRRLSGANERYLDTGRYQQWLREMSGYANASTEVVLRTLRVVDQGVPTNTPTPTGWSYGDKPGTKLGGIAQAQHAAAMAASTTTMKVAAPASTQKAAEPRSTPAPSTVPSPVPPAPVRDELADKVLEIVANKTGYPVDMLALDLDLEADLGIDTVKQAEVFAELRTAFDLPQRDDLKLREYPTLDHVIGYVRDALGVQAPAPATPAAAQTQGMTTAAPVGDSIAEKVLQIVADKTGYPVDMLALDLDLEADLGIDTVKQAEVFAELRTSFDLPQRDDLKLREYPTLEHVIGYVRDALGVQAPAPVTPAASTAPQAPVANTEPAPAASAATDPVAQKVLEIVSEKTGYPTDMLELDLDLEADLGVDTVKQAEVFAELRTAFELPQRDDLKLREYPTLQHVIGYVRESRPDLAPAPAQAPAPTTTAPQPETKTAPAGEHDDVTKAVLDVVAEKTGYPTDMLDLDLDMEADLGVDTVKQAEVFAMVRERFDIPSVTDLKLRDYPTLAHVVQFVRDNMKTPAAAEQSADQGADPDAAPVTKGERRLVPTPIVRPSLEMSKATGATIKEGDVVLVVGEGDLADQMASTVREQKAEAVHIAKLDEDGLKQAREAAERSVTGVIYLSGATSPGSIDELDVDAFREVLQHNVRNLFALSKDLYDALDKQGAFFLSATRMGGTFGYGSVPSADPFAGAVSGFTKALARERTSTIVKVVDFPVDSDNKSIAATILAEIMRDPGAIEIGYADGKRWSITLVDAAPVNRDEQPELPIRPGHVVVVTGAGGEITSAIAADIAQSSHASFYLLDLPPKPDASNPDLERLTTDRDGLKRDIAERLRQGGAERVTPVMVEKELGRLEREAATLRGIQAVEKAGGKATYMSCDMTNTAAVKEVMSQLLFRHNGKIDVIIHAAGLERSRPIPSKPQQEFDLVFDVKVMGMYNLLAATRGAKIGAIVSFSSVAGRFGNAGQTDYSSANDFLCKISSAMQTLRPETRAVAIDWTAWAGIGMATRGSIPEIMKRAGIEMLSPEDGIPVVREEIERGRRGELLIGGALGILTQERDEHGGAEAGALVEGSLVPTKLLRADPYEGVVFEVQLDPKQPFLDDHRIEGVPVLPGVMGVELFAQAAKALRPDLDMVKATDVQFAAPFKCYRDEVRSGLVTIHLVDTGSGIQARCTLTSVQVIKGTNQTAPPKQHFAAILELGERKRSEAATDGLPAVGENAATVSREDLYEAYFHGPSFQVLDSTQVPEDGKSLIGRLQQPMPALLATEGATPLTAPRLLELCFQTAGVIEIGSTRKLGLPSHIDEVQVYAEANDQGVRVAVVQSKQVDEGLRFEAKVLDDHGEVLMSLSGYSTSALPTGMEESVWAPFAAGLKGYES